MPIEVANTVIGGHHGVAVKVTGPSGLVYLSGISPNPIYHGEPMSEQEAQVPASIWEQTQWMLSNLDRSLAGAGLGWPDVAKIILYLTDIREAGAVRALIAETYGHQWSPAFTTVQVDNLVARGTRVELDVIAAGAPD